jgi:hypothetical protein
MFQHGSMTRDHNYSSGCNIGWDGVGVKVNREPATVGPLANISAKQPSARPNTAGMRPLGIDAAAVAGVRTGLMSWLANLFYG